MGVIKAEQESIPYHEGVYQRFTPEEIDSHVPQYTVVPYSKGKEPKPLTVSQMTQRRNHKLHNLVKIIRIN